MHCRDTLPYQRNTLVGDRGYSLSRSERDCMTFARLLLAQPRAESPDERRPQRSTRRR